METRPTIHTVPTQLGRQDGFIYLAIVLGFGLVGWEAILNGVPWWTMVVPGILVSVATLTSEPAGDVRVVGALAAGLRSKCGMRSAHEWCLAFGHYFIVRIWPDFKRWARGTRLVRRTAEVYLRACENWSAAGLVRRMRSRMRQVRRRLRRLPQTA